MRISDVHFSHRRVMERSDARRAGGSQPKSSSHIYRKRFGLSLLVVASRRVVSRRRCRATVRSKRLITTRDGLSVQAREIEALSRVTSALRVWL